MERVAVVGSGGAGKTTFARALGERTGLPVVHLDEHHWLPGWVEAPREEWHALQEALIDRDRWIVDGNYGGSFDTRFARADTVVVLALPRAQCILGVLRRSAMLRTGLIGSELASDIRFLAEMAMLGKFAVVPEYLFGRRFHEESSSWAREDAEWQRRYYAPGRARVARFGTWRRYLHLLHRAARVPLPLAERWQLLRFLGRRMRWQRGVLFEELLRSAVPSRQATVTHPR